MASQSREGRWTRLLVHPLWNVKQALRARSKKRLPEVHQLLNLSRRSPKQKQLHLRHQSERMPAAPKLHPLRLLVLYRLLSALLMQTRLQGDPRALA